MDTRTLLRERLRRSRDWAAAIDELEKELEATGTRPEQSEWLFELAALVEDVIPERERALGLYQRAWKLHPDNLKALSRAREVYGEIGRFEMVAKLGEMELRSPAAAATLPAIVGEALVDSGQKDRALPILERALENTPDSVRVKDALAAISYDPEFWTDEVERLTDEADRFDEATAVRMLVRAARILRIEAPEDPRLEEVLRRVLAKDLDEPSTNFLFETLLAGTGRWDELEAHHLRRADRAPDHARKVEALRTFGLEWVQRFKDRDRGAKFFDAALRGTVANGAVAMRSVVAAYSLVHQVLGERGDWAALVALAAELLDRPSGIAGEARLYVAVQAGQIAFEKANDLSRARQFFAAAAAIEPQNAAVREFVEAIGLEDEATALPAPPPPAPVAVAVAVAVVAPPPVAEPPVVEPPMPAIAAPPPEVIPPSEAPPAVQAGDAAPVASPDTELAPAAGAASPVPVAEAAPVAPVAVAPAPVAPAPVAPVAPVPAPAAPAEERRRSVSTPPPIASADLEASMRAARAAEAGADRGVMAWKDVIAKHPAAREPRRELVRVLRGAQSWAQLADALKDEEAKAVSSGPDKADVLLELAEVYGKLNNDNQVMSALSLALTHDPSRLEIYDRLSALYEAKKRWPDLVKVLLEKADRVSHEAGGKVAIYLQVANLYLERFSNQAEAIKAFERVLELDPDNQQAIDHLLAVYEKRRDWEKLIKLKESEVDRSPELERGAKVIEVARMAATKVKKPEICTYWWEKVLAYEPTHEEALTELYKLYERNREWDKLADICSRQADVAADDKARGEALQRLGLLYTEKVENSAKAIEAWQRLLRIDDGNRRAQDALKKLYVSEARWDDLEEFYRSRGKLDEYIRVLEREVDAGSETHRLALAMKIAVLYRDELQKPDRAMRAFEKVLTLDEQNLEAAEALIPLYETGRDPRALVRVLEIQLAATPSSELHLRQDRIKRLAQYNEEKLRDKGAAFGWWLKAHAEDHEAEWIRAELERLAGETNGWGLLVDAYAASLPRFAVARDGLPVMLVMARVIEREQGEVERALDMNRQILAIDDSNEQALDALERLYLGKGQFQDLLDIYEKKLELTTDGDQRIAIQSKIGQLYEDEVKDDPKAIAAYQAILDAAGDEPSALRSLDRVYLRNAMWKPLADILSRQLTIVGPDEDKQAHVELKYRLGQLREQHLSDVPGAIDAYRDILDLMPAHERGRAALEKFLAAGAASEAYRLTAAAILEPVYEQLGEWAQLVGVHEIQLAAERDPLRRSELLLKIGELSRGKLLDAERAFDAYARAFTEDPSVEVAKHQLEALAALLDDGWPRLVALFEAALARDGRADELDPPLAHELATKVARSYEDRIGNTEKAIEFYKRALAIEPDDLAALTALEAIFTRDEKYPDLLDVYRRRVDIAEDADQRLGFLFRIAALHEEMLGSQDEAIATYLEILGQAPDDMKALRALDRLYVARGAWRDLGDNISRQLTLVAEAEGGQADQVALLVRLAQLRETHLGETAAAVETYRQVLDLEDQNRDAVAALERLIGASGGEHELTIAGILEPIYKARGEWSKQIGVYEIMARHSFDPVRKIELLHRISELHEIGGDDADAAFATFSRALREDPRNDTTHRELDRLARGLSKWPETAALGVHPSPARDLGISASRRLVVPAAGHLDLLDAPPVYAQLRAWLAEVAAQNR